MRLFVRFGFLPVAAAIALAGMGAAAGVAVASRPAKATTATNGEGITFTTGQVERGEESYIENCVMCHGYNLNDGEFGPPIKGSFFQKKWSGKSVGELYTLTIMTMPQSNPDSLAPETYADIMAYMFKANGIAPGDKDLSSDAGALNSVPLPW